jgi:hypothetical protein
VSISVVVPTVEGREEMLGRVALAFTRTTPLEDFQFIVERGHEVCGTAWQAGAEKAEGDFILFCADDLEPMDGWWQPLVESAERGEVPCPVVYEADGCVQSAGALDWDLQTRIPADGSPTGWTTVPFIRREWWPLIDPMLPVHYCTDTWVSVRLARHGIRTVVRTGSGFIHHNAAPARGAGMDVHARNIHDRARFYEAVEMMDAWVA